MPDYYIIICEMGRVVQANFGSCPLIMVLYGKQRKTMKMHFSEVGLAEVGFFVYNHGLYEMLHEIKLKNFRSVWMKV